MNELEKMSIVEIKAALFDCDQNIKRQQQIFNVLAERLGVLIKDESDRAEHQNTTKGNQEKAVKTE